MKNGFLIPIERVHLSILHIRNERVILDADLALLYGVTTKRLNEQVKRNQKRFPGDFMFQLTKHEKAEVVANCDHLQKLKFSRTRPLLSLSTAPSWLQTFSTATELLKRVYRFSAFVRLRSLVSTHQEIAAQLAKLESHLARHDDEIEVIFEALRSLMKPPVKNEKQIGFRSKSLHSKLI